MDLLKKIFYFPLTRIIIGLVACVTTANVFQYFFKLLANLTAIPAGDLRTAFIDVPPLIPFLISYGLLFKYYERRKVAEISLRKFFPNALLGTLIGGGLQSLVILILFLLGMYSVVAVHGAMSLLPGLVVSLTSGVIEEVAFRGIIFRITEEKLGSIYALAITAALFGVAHIMNPNATLYSAFSIAVEAGILLGAAFMVSRSLWLPIFLHIAWNFTESAVFGTALSGFDTQVSLISCKMLGPALVTGGSFGPENSILALGFCSSAGAILLYRAYKKNLFLQPFWKFKTVQPTTPA